MKHIQIISLMLMTFSVGLCSPATMVESQAEIKIYPNEVICPLHKTLFGTNVHPGVDKNLMPKPEYIETVKKLGIYSCRFPNGCVADLYNWKNPGANEATVDEFLDFCEAIGAEPYYTINMQGGTDGLQNPIPQNAPLEEIIRYQHLQPNPCGYTNYHFGTLAETLELVQKYTIDRALAGKKPILCYEMGNENWGQSRTDWPPPVYAKTIEVYAKAMRKLLEDAKENHPELKQYNLYIVAVGYPVMGNNMQMVDTPDRTINVLWTSLLNKLYEEKIIDAVQEHYYPYGYGNGGALVWAAHNLHNILYARLNLPNERLNGYKDPAIAYKMPIEFTEWNIKCWGPQYSQDVQLVNPGFEDGTNGWTIVGGSARTVSWASRRGSKGLRVIVDEKNGPCEVRQTFNNVEKLRHWIAGIWIKTDNPEAVRVQFRNADAANKKDAIIGGWKATAINTWERVIASTAPKSDVKKIELAIVIDKPATVYIDEVILYHVNDDRPVPISATTFEQALFCVDAIRAMALAGSPRSHLHHLSGDYACGSLSSKGEIKDLAKAFVFFNSKYGDSVVKAELKCDTFTYQTAANKWATDFNALAPNRDDIPMLGIMASRKDNMIYLLMINRSSDRKVNVKIDLGAEPSEKKSEVRILSGKDIDLPGAEISEEIISIGKTFTHVVKPYQAHIISIKI